MFPPDEGASVDRWTKEPHVGQVVLATGVSVPYVSAGPAAGAPVVLLHAWGESWRSFDRLLPLLPGTVHAVAMDLRGHGDADKPAAGYSLAEVTADVAALNRAPPMRACPRASFPPFPALPGDHRRPSGTSVWPVVTLIHKLAGRPR